MEDQVVAMLPCNHIFEKNSILQWLTEESHKCPVCRYEMDFIEKKDESVILPINNVRSSLIDNSNNNINYGNRLTSFLDRMYERREEREIQRAIEESLKTFDENNEDEEVEDSDEEILF